MSFIDGDMERAIGFTRTSETTVWHAVGTCAMALEGKGGVVDYRLRVYGVRGRPRGLMRA
jgi:choline dehydrogenase-like flavoprotein